MNKTVTFAIKFFMKNGNAIETGIQISDNSPLYLATKNSGCFFSSDYVKKEEERIRKRVRCAVENNKDQCVVFGGCYINAKEIVCAMVSVHKSTSF